MYDFMIDLCDVGYLRNRLSITPVAVLDHLMVHHEKFVHTLIGPIRR